MEQMQMQMIRSCRDRSYFLHMNRRIVISGLEKHYQSVYVLKMGIAVCPQKGNDMQKGFLKRKMLRFYFKIVREKAPPEYIARGWAIGMFYGCLIPFGFQLLCSIPTAILLKGSKIGATFGTLITNHFSVFIIYPLQCYVGLILIGKRRTFAELEEIMKMVIEKGDYQTLFGIGTELVAAFFIGGFLLTALMTPLTYFFVKNLVIKYRAKRSKA